MSNAGWVSKELTAATIGYDRQLVEVECNLKAGLPPLQIVGMESKAINKAIEWVRSAITNSLLAFPAKKFIIHLAPAELPKDAGRYDVPIAEVTGDSDMTTLYLPEDNIAQAQLVDGLNLIPATPLTDLFLHLKKESVINSHSQLSVDSLSTDLNPVDGLLGGDRKEYTCSLLQNLDTSST